jgi:chromosome condensin MukBEF complex kleisin-like MukF subunit
MTYTIDGTTYTLKEIQDILDGVGNPSSDLQTAALDIQEAIDRGD